MTVTVGSLFSGIGGLDLGLERAGMTVIWQSEVDPYCCRVLAKHWPTVPNLGDVTKVDWSTVERPDVICGGYPCQPFSQAGRKQGAVDTRHLWPYMVDALRVLRPRFAVMENVPGHLVNGFGRVLGDLAESGYSARWDCVSASSVGAPHIRDRVFIVADPEEFTEWPGLRANESSTQWWRRPRDSRGPDRIEPCPACEEDWCHWHAQHRYDCGCVDPWDESDDPDFGWWATEPNVGRVAHGVPYRVDRLRGLGNAVVPQVAEYIGRQLLAAL